MDRLMAYWKDLSLQARLLLTVGVSLFGIALAAQHLQFRQFAEEYQRDLDADLSNSMEVAAQGISDPIVVGDYTAVQQILQAKVARPAIDEIVWYDGKGGIVRARNASGAAAAPSWFLAWSGMRQREIVHNIRIGGADYGTLIMHGSPAIWEDRLWRDFLRQLLVQTAEIVLVFLLIASLLRKNLWPLRQITQGAQRFIGGDLSVRMPPMPHLVPEMRTMVSALNQAADSMGSLLQSLAEQRRATDNAAIVVESDLDDRITYVNDKFSRTTGFSREEIMGQYHRVMDSGVHSQAFFDELWQTINQGQVWNGEVCCRTKGGRLFWVNNIITPIRDSRNRIQKFISIQFDITDRKLAQEALEQQLHFVQQLLEAIPVPVFFKDAEGRYLGVNHAWEAFFGISRESFLGKTVFDLYAAYPGIAAMHAANDRDLFARGGAQAYDIQVPDAAGRMRDTHFTKAVFSRADGTSAGLIGIIHDVTEQKRSEEELKRIVQAVNEVGDAINICDPTGRAVFVNKTFVSMFGYTRDELNGAGGPAVALMNPQLSAEVCGVVKGGSPWQGELDLSGRDKKTIPTLFRASPVRNDEGEVIGLISVITDLTEHQRAARVSQRLGRVLDNSLTEIYVLDAETLQFIQANRGALQNLGETQETLLASNLFEITPPASRQYIIEALGPLRSGKTTQVVFETEFLRKDGSSYPIEISLQFTSEGGRPALLAIGRDITSRKAAEEALQESEQKFRTLVETLHDWVWELDGQGRYSYVSPRVRDILGYEPEEAIGKRPADLMPPQEAQRSAIVFGNALAAESPFHLLEVTHLRKDGRQVTLETSGTPIFDEHGQLFGYRGLSRDITERKISRDLVRRQAMIIDQTHDAVIMTDTNGLVLEWNHGAEAMFGYAKEEAWGISFVHLLGKDNSRVESLGDPSALTNGDTRQFELALSRKSGEPFHAHFSLSRITNDEGTPIGIAWYAVDITAQKETEAHLRESEARFRAMTAKVPGMVFQFMLGTGGKLKFLYVSEGARQVAEVQPEEIMDDAGVFLALISTEDIPSFRKTMSASLKQLMTWNWEGRILAGARTKWVNLRASPRVQTNGDVIWDGLVLNITEAKTAQLAVLQSQEQLRELSGYLQTVREEEKTHIAREIHDELGGLLTAIKMDAFWLARKIPEDLQPLQEKLGAMSGLVDSAIQSTRRISTELRPTVLDDLGLAAAMEWQISEFQKRMGIPCEALIEHWDQPLPESHSIALFRILQESLTNIARHSQATQVQIHLDVDGTGETLTIADNGKGITEDRILNPTSHGIRGIFERARHLGGDVKIDSAPGKGTTISVTLPNDKDLRQLPINW